MFHEAGILTAQLGYKYHGEYQKAKGYYEKALAIAIKIVDRKNELGFYIILGDVSEPPGEYQKAKGYYEKALSIAIESGDRNNELGCYGMIGYASKSLAEYQKAKENWEKAPAVAIETGDWKEKTLYDSLRNVSGSLEEFQEAKGYHLKKSMQETEYYGEKALAISLEIGDRRGEGACHSSLGNVSESLGEYKKAKDN
ncbi:G-protein-signaling modulator 2 [Stylophora pistillata]|uniref:G-protein-signaling modulator 2 n=1 Tax=Stylophora pistillata TaxID=50429 RepID=A0A2B4SXC5_STYPI|nr:G-protein-signaling modulator 2 [Stylophora pistillata]